VHGATFCTFASVGIDHPLEEPRNLFTGLKTVYRPVCSHGDRAQYNAAIWSPSLVAKVSLYWLRKAVISASSSFTMYLSRPVDISLYTLAALGHRDTVPAINDGDPLSGRFCCRSRKSNNSKTLAKVALWASLRLRGFFNAATKVGDRIWINRYGPSRRRAQNASAAALRIFCSTLQKDFCNMG